jgi:ribonuclease HI
MGEEVAARYCQVSVQGRYIRAKNFSLRERLEIMVAELIAAYQALKDVQDQGLQGKDIHVFVDSQAALKRLQDISLTGGQKVCHEITELCKQLVLHNNRICASWVPKHREIQGNEHDDRLPKAGLKREVKDPLTSLSYLKRKAKEEILASWKESWKNTRERKKAGHTPRSYRTGL